MGRARRVLLLIPVFALLAVSACGGDSGVPAATTVPADQAIAESLRLTIADFPAEWKEEPEETDSSANPLDTCDPGDARGRTGLAETGDFALGGDSVSNSVAVFLSADAALAVLDRIPDQGKCMVKEIKNGALDDENFEALDATFEPMSFPATGDRVEAHRFTMTLKQLDSGLELKVTLDLVYAVKGRVGFSLSAQGVLAPFDSAMLESLAATMTQRLP